MTTVPEARSFFKVYFPELYAERLELAHAFCLKVKGPPLGPASLRGPSGNVWKVEVVEEDGRRFFRGAWPNFVKDHSLLPGEFLVFEWDGCSSYEVIILDYSMCDKANAFVVSPSSTDDQSGLEELGMKTPRPGPGRPRKYWPGTEQSSNSMKGKRIFLSQRRPVQKEEIDRAHKAAYSFRSSNPFIVLIMRKSSVYTGYMLNIPTLFAKIHLSQATEEMVLKDSEGRRWTVNLVAGRTGCFMSAGWRRFCIENHLEEYDACVFELIDPKTFQVHIFRVVEEITPMMAKTIIRM